MNPVTFRHAVGKTTISGYVSVNPQQQGFFGINAESAGRNIEILFNQGQQITARLQRTGGAKNLQLIFTGKDGEPFRRWLNKTFRPRGPRRPRGVLVLAQTEDGRFLASTESVKEALVEKLRLGARHYLEGAKPISILHPALMGLDALIQAIALPPPAPASYLQDRIEKALQQAGWQGGQTVGAGLSLRAGLRRSQAELHVVLEMSKLYSALLSLAAGFEVKAIDLGVLMIAEGPLSSRLRQDREEAATSLKRAMEEIEVLGFLIRGPVLLAGLEMHKILR